MNESTAQLEWYRVAAYTNLCGGHGVRVTEVEKLTETIDKALQFKGLALVEIITDADLIQVSY